MPDYGIPFKDAQLHIYTGGQTASGSALGFVDSTQIFPSWQWQTDASLSGTYRDHLVGIHCRFSMQAIYTTDQRIERLAQSATALHFKLIQNNIHGSAGYFMYTAHIDNLALQGGNGNVWRYTLNAHANLWSAF